MIDPAIWLNEDVAKLSPLNRLLFIGLFSNADDEGRLRGSAVYLKSLIFPYDRLKPSIISKALMQMNRIGIIRYYKVNAEWYIEHPKWRKHQYIDRPRSSQLPPSPTYRRAVGEASLPIQQQHKTTQPNPIKSNTIQPNKGDDVLELLQSVGITKISAVVLKQSYSEDLIRKAFTESQGKRSRAGYIIEALKKGWIKV